MIKTQIPKFLGRDIRKQTPPPQCVEFCIWGLKIHVFEKLFNNRLQIQ